MENDETTLLVDSHRGKDVGLWLEERSSDSSHLSECDVVVPAHLYDLGMRTRKEMRRQIEVDITRSFIFIKGNRTTSVEEVIRSAFNPRMCTQASLAPPLEWISRNGFFACEIGSEMRAEIEPDGTVNVTKRLGVGKMDVDSVFITRCVHFHLEVTIQAGRHAVVVSFRFVERPASQ